MHVPTANELAAIAAAYVAVTARTASPMPSQTLRWSFAGRLPDVDDESVRFAATSTSRWNAAGRLDG